MHIRKSGNRVIGFSVARGRRRPRECRGDGVLGSAAWGYGVTHVSRRRRGEGGATAGPRWWPPPPGVDERFRRAPNPPSRRVASRRSRFTRRGAAGSERGGRRAVGEREGGKGGWEIGWERNGRWIAHDTIERRCRRWSSGGRGVEGGRFARSLSLRRQQRRRGRPLRWTPRHFLTVAPIIVAWGALSVRDKCPASAFSCSPSVRCGTEIQVAAVTFFPPRTYTIRRRAHIRACVAHVAQVWIHMRACVRVRPYVRAPTTVLWAVIWLWRTRTIDTHAGTTPATRSSRPGERPAGSRAERVNYVVEPGAPSSRLPPRSGSHGFSSQQTTTAAPVTRVCRNSPASPLSFFFLWRDARSRGEKNDCEEISWNECRARPSEWLLSQMHISAFLFCSRKRRRW